MHLAGQRAGALKFERGFLMKIYQLSRKNTGIVAICLLFIFSVSGISWAQPEKGKMEITGFYEMSDIRKVQYIKKRIDTLDKRIKYFNDELQWLELKIAKIHDSDRIVPYELVKSQKFKKNKIRSLSKAKVDLERALEKELNDKVPQKTDEPSGSEKDPGRDECKLDKNRLSRHIKKENLDEWVHVVEEGSCLKLDTTLPILFSSGSARIAEEYKSFFKRFARFLDTYDVRVLVNGYTDPDPISTEKYPTNFELGAARAANVVHELVKHGLKPSIFQIGSTAEHRFEAQGLSPKKTMERKAEVTVIFTS